jgi:hypothetical protein
MVLEPSPPKQTWCSPSGGTYDAIQGACVCGERTRGVHCNLCDQSWFGDACQVYSVLSEICSKHGRSLADGSCECAPNWAGEKCDRCAQGFFGRECTAYCDQEHTCGGRGDCDNAGNCKMHVVTGQVRAGDGSFTLTRSGWYNVHVTGSSADARREISGSPFAVHVRPAPISAVSSWLGGQRTVWHDKIMTFDVMFRDEFGNTVTPESGNNDVSLSVRTAHAQEGSDTVVLHKLAGTDGSIRVFSSTQLDPGAYSVHVTLGNSESSSLVPFEFTVVPPGSVYVVEAFVRRDMAGSMLSIVLSHAFAKQAPSCYDIFDRSMVDAVLGGRDCHLVMVAATKAVVLLGQGRRISAGAYLSLKSKRDFVVRDICKCDHVLSFPVLFHYSSLVIHDIQHLYAVLITEGNKPWGFRWACFDLTLVNQV